MASGSSRSWEQSPRKSERIVTTTSTGTSSSCVASMRSCANGEASVLMVCSAPLAWKRNSSSNWSTTTSTRPPSSVPPCRTASASPKPLRRSVASTCAAAFHRVRVVGRQDLRCGEGAGEVVDRVGAGAERRDAPVRAHAGREPAEERGQQTCVHERRLPAGRGAHHGHEPRSRQLGGAARRRVRSDRRTGAPPTHERAAVPDRG